MRSLRRTRPLSVFSVVVSDQLDNFRTRDEYERFEPLAVDDMSVLAAESLHNDSSDTARPTVYVQSRHNSLYGAF